VSLEKSRNQESLPIVEFQGLDIAIENPVGSVRGWTDFMYDREGQTTMKYPYGFIKNTLGVDGDEVDVFVGPDKSSCRVFVVTQMIAGANDYADEQKVMLGFSSAEEAKLAFLDHYPDPRFFGDMKELSLDEFKACLCYDQGKFIKSALNLKFDSGRINQETIGLSRIYVDESRSLTLYVDNMNKSLKKKSKAPKKYREGGATRRAQYAVPQEFKYPIDTEAHVRAAISYFSKPGNANVYSESEQKTIWGRIKRAAKKYKISFGKESGPPSVEKENNVKKSQGAVNILFAVTSKMVEEVVKSREAIDRVEKGLTSLDVLGMVRDRGDQYKAGIAREQPVIGTNRERPQHEPPVVPVRRVEAPPQAVSGSPLSSCGACGYMHKGRVGECPRCVQVLGAPVEFPNLWRN